MNCFSSINSVTKPIKINDVFSVIQRYQQLLGLGVSGDSYVDLSSTSSYSTTSLGINTNNNQNTCIILSRNANNLKTTDFAPQTTSSFTIYFKHNCRLNTLPILNFAYPNFILMSTNASSLQIKCYSFLDPGTSVDYTISGTGVTTSMLNTSSLTGIFLAPIGELNYTLTGAYGKTIQFAALGAIPRSMSIPLPPLNFTYTEILDISNSNPTLTDINKINLTTFLMAISPSGLNYAIKFHADPDMNLGFNFLSNTNGTIFKTFNFNDQYGDTIAQKCYAISDGDVSNCVIGFGHANNSAGATFRFYPKVDYNSNFSQSGHFINFSETSNSITQAIYGTNYTMYSRNINILDTSDNNVYTNVPFPVLQIATSKTFNYMLCSTDIGSTIEFYISSDKFSSKTLLLDEFSTAITSTNTGLVYVSATGAFMAIGTDSGFYYSTNQFSSYTSITSGDYFKNFFYFDFRYDKGYSDWFAYNENTKLSFFLKSEDYGASSQLCYSVDFITSSIITTSVVVSRREPHVYEKNYNYFKSSANAEKFLLYGTKSGTTAFYYVSSGLT